MKKRKNYTKSVGILIFCVLIFALLSSCDLLRGNDANNTANNQSDEENNTVTEEHIHDFKPGYDIESHFVGCTCGEKINTEAHSFDWVIDSEASYLVPGYKHKECQTCGYVADENTDFSEDKNEDGTLKLDSELIISLSKYLKDFFIEYEIPAFNFGQKLDMCKSDIDPVLADFGSECYYVVAYYSADDGHLEDFCCVDNYTWIGFQKAEDIQRTWNDNDFAAAFQINPTEYSIDLKTKEMNIVKAHFSFFIPQFNDESALEPEIVFNNPFIILDEEKPAYYSSKADLHELMSFDCVKLDGEYFVKFLMKIDYDDERSYEANLQESFGAHYDDLMEIIITDRYSEDTEGIAYYYALFGIWDLVNVINMGS